MRNNTKNRGVGATRIGFRNTKFADDASSASNLGTWQNINFTRIQIEITEHLV